MPPMIKPIRNAASSKQEKKTENVDSLCNVSNPWDKDEECKGTNVVCSASGDENCERAEFDVLEYGLNVLYGCAVWQIVYMALPFRLISQPSVFCLRAFASISSRIQSMRSSRVLTAK